MGLPVEKSSYISNSKRLPRHFLAALAMIFLFESTNVYFDNYFYMYPFEGLRMKIKNEVSQSRGSHFDILVFGDCYNLTGVMPRTIEKETGLVCYNFSTHFIQTIFPSYCMLKNYLVAPSRRPRYIIIGFLATSLAVTKENIKKESLPHLYEFVKGNEAMFLKEFGIGQALNLLTPSLKHQYFFNDFLKNLMSFSRVRGKREIDDFIKSVYNDGGYYAWRSNDAYREAISDDKNPTDFSVSPFFTKYFNKFLELAKKNNITVIYLMPSTTLDWQERDRRYGVPAKYEIFLNSLKKDYPDLIILKPQHLLNEKALYVDQRHLNGRGALDLSEFIARKINELSASSSSSL